MEHCLVWRQGEVQVEAQGFDASSSKRTNFHASLIHTDKIKSSQAKWRKIHCLQMLKWKKKHNGGLCSLDTTVRTCVCVCVCIDSFVLELQVLNIQPELFVASGICEPDPHFALKKKQLRISRECRDTTSWNIRIHPVYRCVQKCVLCVFALEARYLGSWLSVWWSKGQRNASGGVLAGSSVSHDHR